MVDLLLINSKRTHLSFVCQKSALHILASVIFLFPLRSTSKPMCDFFIQLEAVEEKASMEEEDLRHKLNARLIEHLKGALPSLKVYFQIYM